MQTHQDEGLVFGNILTHDDLLGEPSGVVLHEIFQSLKLSNPPQLPIEFAERNLALSIPRIHIQAWIAL
jgi:hypothetical protein